MYLRTTTRRNRDGSEVTYYQLAHNERHPDHGRSVPRIIHSFGRANDQNQEQLARLCKSIGRVCGLRVLDPLDTGEEESQGAQEPRLPDDVKLQGTVCLGTVLAIEKLWEFLGIGPALRKAEKKDCCKVHYERALLAMTANRLCAPESKLGVWDRWLEKVYLPSCEGLKLRQMYEAMDLLHRHTEEVEKDVFFETANLFNREVDIVFYDTTTTSFSIDYADEDDEDGEGLRKFGHGKEGTWDLQVVVALAVTNEGLPIRSWVFPGNTTDVTTVERVKADLRDWKLGRVMFVADSGMNSGENKRELARACGKYLLASRAGSVKEIKDDVLKRPGRYKTIAENLRVKEVVVGGKESVRRRRYFVCHNPKQEKRERRHREEVVKDLEKELARHPDLEATQQWAIELKASGRYGRYLKITGGKLRINRKKIQEVARNDGKWVIETNDDTITPEDAAEGYKALAVIERCFRQLKRTQIKMSPMYHWLRKRIEAHVKICVLALLIERVAERKCSKPWRWIREELDKLQATRFQTDTHEFFQRNEPSKVTVGTLRKLGASLPKRVLDVKPLS